MRASLSIDKMKFKDLTPAEIATEMRKDLMCLLQENLLINSAQLTQRKQLGRVFNKYFHGYRGSIDTKLLVESLELHYEGIDARAR